MKIKQNIILFTKSYSTAFLLIFLLLSLTLSIFNAPNSQAEDSPDAIAIRVIPNDKHYSPSRWYKDQGFSGSPQSLVVDGYEAIRDGRTVYVNAANIDSGHLYTNIYLISYNQEAETPTVDIFGRILSRWKFNTNISGVGQCSVSKTENCLTDANCPVNEYCSSAKATIARDTIRLSRLFEVNESLKQYYDSHNKTYPKLQAGTYLSGRTVSAWPSWDDSLAKDLGVSLPKDPINKLGNCGDKKFDPVTCWDEKSKTFAGSIPNDLPDNSHVYVYNAKNNGTAYDLCAVMESGLITSLGEGACLGSNVVPPVEPPVNTPPIITEADLPTAYAGQPYAGHIKAYDSDIGDSLTFMYLLQPDWSASGVNPVIASVNGGADITSPKAGAIGTYSIIIIARDKQGEETSKNYQVKVENAPPVVVPPPPVVSVAPVIDAIANKEYIIGSPVDFTITASDADAQYPLNFSINGLPAGLSGVLLANKHDYKISGNPVDQTKDYNIAVTATDLGNNVSVVKEFKITIKNNPPIISSAPQQNYIACGNQVNYSYQAVANDPDGHSVNNFLAVGLEAVGLFVDNATGLVSGQPKVAGSYPITITAKDQYSAQTVAPYSASVSQDFNLNISDENFSVTAPVDKILTWTYVNKALNLYKQDPLDPAQYNETASANAFDSVSWSLENNPIWLNVNAGTGVIEGTPSPAVNDNDIFNVTAKAVNQCGVSKSDTFSVTVDILEWCGNGFQQAGEGEECDDGNNVDGDGCSASCKSEAVCGDGIVQAPNSKGINEICDDGALNGAPGNCKLTCDGIIPLNLVNGQHTELECTTAGGIAVNDGGGNRFCKFSANSCLAGWTQYADWSKTNSVNCSAIGNCFWPVGTNNLCDTGSHIFSNQLKETCVYYIPAGFMKMTCVGPPQTCFATIAEIGCY